MPIGGIPTGWDIRVSLSYYSDYLSSLEKFLENEARVLGERYDAKAQKIITEAKKRTNRSGYTLPPQLNEVELELGALDYFFFEEEHKLEDIFPNMLRRWFFIAIYSLIERQLNEICREQERSKGLSKPLEKVDRPPDQSIRRAKKYLMDVAKIRFPESSEWDELLKYQKLRNCIVHNEGKLKGMRKLEDKEELKQYIEDSHDFLALNSDGDEIIFRKGFCEKVLQVSRRFFTDLFATLTSEEEGDF
jgi:hypothetical protein